MVSPYKWEEHPAVESEVARCGRKDSVDAMDFTDDDTKGEKGQRQVGKKVKSNKITLTPNRPGFQVTPNG
jgi:hypothetical protein